MANYVIKKDISTDAFTTNRAYGIDPAADTFALVASSNSPIKKLTLHISSDRILRARLEKMDSTVVTVGRDPVGLDSARELEWSFSPDERFKEIKIYVELGSKVLAGLKMVTNKHTMETLAWKEKKYEAEDVPVGCGMCVGMFGNARNSLASLGFAMLKKLPPHDELQRLEREQKEKHRDSGRKH